MKAAHEKPSVHNVPTHSAPEAAKRFGAILKQAKERPQYITVNGHITAVVMDYQNYEDMYMRLQELEDQIIEKRIDDLENHPEAAVSWRSIRK